MLLYTTIARMADISNLKINERSNFNELTRVTTIENENLEDKASQLIYIKGKT